MTGLLGDFITPAAVRSNRLFYGDNLTIMQNMPTACVDLIYLDPPFNSQRTYNLIYKQTTGLPVPEQEEAFCDAWEMDDEKIEMARKMPIVLRDYGADESLVAFWSAWIRALRDVQPRLLAYLIYMTYRLFEMRRILKPTGSLYLHCDPTASHYIKVIMDSVFGHDNFMNEIVWQRTSSHNDPRRYGRIHDVLLYYAKSGSFAWNPIYEPFDKDFFEAHDFETDENGNVYRKRDLTAPHRKGESGQYEWKGKKPSRGRMWSYTIENMRRLEAEGRIVYTRTGMPRLKIYATELRGLPLQDVWTNPALWLNAGAKERLGYQTQKPIALLDRIIMASTNPGEVVFDPFCGCGTAIYAAHLTGRQWIGCDIAILSVRLVRDVLRKRYGLQEGRDYEVAGVPTSVAGAQELFDHDPHQFQHWAVELAGGFCNSKRSGDKGVDGRIHFETADGLRNMVLSVKGGKLSPSYVRELYGTIGAPTGGTLGGFICLDEKVTQGMKEAARNAGKWTYDEWEYDRVQIRTIADLLAKRGFDTPGRVEPLDWERQGRLPF
jgi:DNA modification methylase